jgi:hypothetical protein
MTRPGRGDAAGQNRIAHRFAWPKRVEQLDLADDPLAMLDQVDEDVEDLGLDLDQPPSTVHRESGEIEDAILERVGHGPRIGLWGNC